MDFDFPDLKTPGKVSAITSVMVTAPSSALAHGIGAPVACTAWAAIMIARTDGSFSALKLSFVEDAEVAEVAEVEGAEADVVEDVEIAEVEDAEVEVVEDAVADVVEDVEADVAPASPSADSTAALNFSIIALTAGQLDPAASA